MVWELPEEEFYLQGDSSQANALEVEKVNPVDLIP